MTIFCGFLSGRAGSDNQTAGLMAQAAGIDADICLKNLLAAPDGGYLNPGLYPDFNTFRADVFTALNRRIKETGEAPCVFILPFNHGNMKNAGKDTDGMAWAVKEYYRKNSLPRPVILVLTSAFYKYVHADLANVPEHLISNEEKQMLARDPELARRTVITFGVAGNLTWPLIKREAAAPLQAAELARYRNGRKTVFFSIGGVVEGPEIRFTENDISKLWAKALEFQQKGYNVLFANSARTPSDMTDLLYEKCLENGNIRLYNAKKIAPDDSDAADFRLYSGKYKKVFQDRHDKTGSIFPAVLSVCDLTVSTKDSFAYTSDAAALGIKTAVYTDMYIDEACRPDCGRLFRSLKDKYILEMNDPRVFDDSFRLPVLPQANGIILNAIQNALKEKAEDTLRS